jgi:hypothetical protein
MSPAAHALDRRLHELRVAQAAVRSALLDLENDGTYAFLASGAMSGTTATRTEPALARVAELRQGLGQLDDLLDQVSSLRDSNQVNHQKAIELVALLNGPSVVVRTQADPQGPATLTATLATRAMSPQEFLAELDQACVPLREAVVEVDTIWRGLQPRLEQATLQAERLAADLPAFPSVTAARTVLATLPSRISEDPLGASDELAQVESTLAAAASVGAEVARLKQELAGATQLLVELDTVLAEGDEALGRSRAEVRDAQGLLDPIDPDAVNGESGLRAWLARLECRVAEGEVTRAAQGLQRWRALAEQTLAAARQVAEANTRPVTRRRELQGLLRAAQVKAGASGRAEDPAITALAGEAQKALAAPCDLAVAQARVDAYLEELRRSPTPAQARPGPVESARTA